MTKKARGPLTALAIIVLVTVAASARADEDADTKLAEARALFTKGTALGRDAHWAEALAAYERSAALRPHAITTFNIAQCQRAIGPYTRARATFAAALAQSQAANGELPDSLAADATRLIAELDRLFAHVVVTIDPPDAAIAIDGAPLAVEAAAARSSDPKGTTPVLVAGILPGGLGAPAVAPTFELVVDPGAHVITLSRKGFTDATVKPTFEAGARTTLRLEAARLPALLHISANQDGAIVTVNGADLGPVPVDLKRPAGTYRVTVKKDGFAPYQTQVSVQAGQETELRVPLEAEKTPITKRWWFWTAAGVLVAGAATGTYFATRPDPTRPEVSGGGLGWKVPVQ